MIAAAPTFTFPPEIHDALVSHDRRLRPEWNPVRRRWEILYLRRPYSLPHPKNQRKTKLGRDKRYALARAITRPDGRPRTACWADYRELRKGDMENVRPRDVLGACIAEEEKHTRERDRCFQDATDNMIAETYKTVALERVTTGWTPE